MLGRVSLSSQRCSGFLNTWTVDTLDVPEHTGTTLRSFAEAGAAPPDHGPDSWRRLCTVEENSSFPQGSPRLQAPAVASVPRVTSWLRWPRCSLARAWLDGSLRWARLAKTEALNLLLLPPGAC